MSQCQCCLTIGMIILLFLTECITVVSPVGKFITARICIQHISNIINIITDSLTDVTTWTLTNRLM